MRNAQANSRDKIFLEAHGTEWRGVGVSPTGNRKGGRPGKSIGRAVISVG